MYIQSSPGGAFNVCEETVGQNYCGTQGGSFSTNACDTSAIVGSCVTATSSINYLEGDAGGLETGCGFQGGTWVTPGGNPDPDPDPDPQPGGDVAQPENTALRAMESDSLCTVTDHGNYYSFIRTNTDRRDNRGVVFYAGGLVAAEAYAKVARNLCITRQDVFLIKGDGVEVFQTNPMAAIEPILANPGMEKWAVAGHSLGGVIASTFIASNPGLVDGLILLASQSAGPVTDPGVKAITIYGSNDLIQTPAEVLGSLPLLPAGTVVVEIEGGNHAQFGNYGEQAGDGEAAISSSKQKSEFKYELRDFMDSL